MTDNASVVAYLLIQGCKVSCVLCRMASEIVLWTEHHSVSLSAQYIPGKENVLSEQLRASPSRSVHHSGEYRTNLPLYILPGPDPMVWKQDALQHPWDHLSAYAFLPFSLLRQVLSRMRLSAGLSVLVRSLWPQKQWFADLLSLLVDEPVTL